jgi:hypothetical protein
MIHTNEIAKNRITGKNNIKKSLKIILEGVNALSSKSSINQSNDTKVSDDDPTRSIG